MSPAVRNVLYYLLIAVGAAVLSTGVQLGALLSGTDPITWRPLLATFVTTLFGTLVTSGGTALLPRPGSEKLDALAKEVGKPAATAALEVEAIKQATGVGGQDLTPRQIEELRTKADQILAWNEARAASEPEDAQR